MRKIVIAASSVGMLCVPAAAWEMQTRNSPVDDSRDVMIAREARTTYSDRYGRIGRANIQIVCQENRTGFALVLPELYTSDLGQMGYVTFRIDKAPAVELKMISANDHGSLAVIGGSAIRFLKSMFNGKSLFVRVATVNESSKEIWFDIDGLEAAAKPIRESCGW